MEKNVKFNWESLYKKSREMIKLKDNDTMMQIDKDFEIVSQVHTEREIISTCRGIGNYCGEFQVITKIEEKDGKFFLIGSDKKLEIEPPQGWPIPDKVQVGDAIYSVERTYAKMESDGKTLWLGSCNRDHQRIKVSQLDNVGYERLVFIHELVHAIIDQFCEELPFTHEQNETFTEAFARGLYQVMKDNPKIFGEVIK